jgi:hypothetical protein
MMGELLASVMEYLLMIHLKKPSIQRELFSKFAYHRFVEGLTILYVSTREYPWSIFFMLCHEDVTLRVKYECSNDRSHRVIGL